VHPRPSNRCNAPLNLDGLLDGLLALLDAVLGLGAHDATAPLLAGILVLLDVALLDGRDELGQLGLVLGADLGDGEDSGGLEVELVMFSLLVQEHGKHTFLWTTVPSLALPLMMA
jgi:hypothetical protein